MLLPTARSLHNTAHITPRSSSPIRLCISASTHPIPSHPNPDPDSCRCRPPTPFQLLPLPSAGFSLLTRSSLVTLAHPHTSTRYFALHSSLSAPPTYSFDWHCRRAASPQVTTAATGSCRHLDTPPARLALSTNTAAALRTTRATLARKSNSAKRHHLEDREVHPQRSGPRIDTSTDSCARVHTHHTDQQPARRAGLASTYKAACGDPASYLVLPQRWRPGYMLVQTFAPSSLQQGTLPAPSAERQQ